MAASSEIQRLTRFSTRLFQHWTPTIAVFSVAATLVGLYVSDWKVTNTKIPYYNKKFEDKGNL